MLESFVRNAFGFNCLQVLVPQFFQLVDVAAELSLSRARLVIWVLGS